ncbi:tRNA dihydrouridine synthase DusB [Enterovirga rhinocerotis]
MSGITDVAFRRVASRFGAGLVVSEMVAATGLVRGDEEARLRSEGQGIRPHVIQLAGRDPRWMAEGARLAEAAGADVIDINMGCPAKKVTGGLAGSALMRELPLALRIVEAVVGAVSVPVTVKMRLGWDHRSCNARDLAVGAAGLGAVAVTVHGRTRQQFYTGTADWAAIAEVVQGCAVPVAANGDVVDLATARQCLAASGAAAVMVGRAALGQPWIIGQIGSALAGEVRAAPSHADRSEAAIDHYEGLLSLYGARMGIRHARKHLAAYADRAREAGFGLPAGERQLLVTTEEPELVLRLLSRLYEEPLRDAA